MFVPTSHLYNSASSNVCICIIFKNVVPRRWKCFGTIKHHFYDAFLIECGSLDVSISYLLVNYGGSIEHQRQLSVQLKSWRLADTTIFKNTMLEFLTWKQWFRVFGYGKYTCSLLRGHMPRSRVNWHLHSHKSIPTPFRSAKSFYINIQQPYFPFSLYSSHGQAQKVGSCCSNSSVRGIDSADQKGAKIGERSCSESSVTIFRLQEFITIEEACMVTRCTSRWHRRWPSINTTAKATKTHRKGCNFN